MNNITNLTAHFGPTKEQKMKDITLLMYESEVVYFDGQLIKNMHGEVEVHHFQLSEVIDQIQDSVYNPLTRKLKISTFKLPDDLIMIENAYVEDSGVHLLMGYVDTNQRFQKVYVSRSEITAKNSQT